MTVYPLQGCAPYYTNCYLVIGEAENAQGSRAAVLIDASVAPQQVRQVLHQYHAKLSAILLTHGHADHIEQLQPLKEAFSVPVWLDARDAQTYDLAADCLYTEAPVTAGDLSLQPIAAPGHTPGSTCLVCGGVLFSGDTLFAGSVGRTDLRGGDGGALCASMARLCAVLREDLQVLPGHGAASTLEEEKRSNPFVRYAMANPHGRF